MNKAKRIMAATIFERVARALDATVLRVDDVRKKRGMVRAPASFTLRNGECISGLAVVEAESV